MDSLRSPRNRVEQLRLISMNVDSSNNSTPSTPNATETWFELPNIEFVLMCEKHREDVLQLVTEVFFRDEPLNRHLTFEIPDEPMEFVELVVSQSIEDQCSFVAIDIDTEQIIGVILNLIKTRSSSNEKIEFRSEKLRFILSVLKDLHRNVNLFDQFECDRLLHMVIIAIDSRYRGLKLTDKLVNVSLERAKTDLRLSGVFSEATSLYSAKVFKKNHFQVYEQTIYAEYDPIRLASLVGEHDRCQLVAKKL